jgi:hypothetical protein
MFPQVKVFEDLSYHGRVGNETYDPLLPSTVWTTIGETFQLWPNMLVSELAAIHLHQVADLC